MWAPIVFFLKQEIRAFLWQIVKLLLLIVGGAIVALSSCLAPSMAVVIVGGQHGGGVVMPQPGANPVLITTPEGSARVGNLLDAALASGCNVPWSIVGGVVGVESSGSGSAHIVGPAITLHNGSVVHAYGPSQFLIPTWNSYGDERIGQVFVGGIEQEPPAGAHIWQAGPSYAATARYLCALGVDSDPVHALWAYSGCVPGPGCVRSDNYPFKVLAIAADLAAAPAPIPVTSGLAGALITEARTWLGTKYVFGGNSRAGIDCSAYVRAVYATVGVDIPRVSQDQYNATIGRGMGVDRPQVGDLAFFARTYVDPVQWITHVGIVSEVDAATGRVTIIHAPGARAAGDPPDMPDGRVREEVIAGFLASHLAGYAHVLPTPANSNQA